MIYRLNLLDTDVERAHRDHDDRPTPYYTVRPQATARGEGSFGVPGGSLKGQSGA